MYLAKDIGGNSWSFGNFRPEHKTRNVIFPCFTYRDAGDAMRWLTDAFGLEKQASFTEHGQVVHAEMSFGGSGIMFGSMREEEPDNPWANAPFGIYVRVGDIDAHYARARAAGAEIIRELNDTSYGAREYSARDIEGNLWSFGTYLPEWMAPA
ncbi:MAG: bleomycin resistance protein [Dehalococcoidia bacterium]|nr:bleomycin resistance protein [Dehalococcoidia bacterium]